MKYKRFATFREASQFARDLSTQHRRSVEITRQGDEYVVPDFHCSSETSKAPSQNQTWTPLAPHDNWWEQRLEEQRRREIEEATRRLSEEQRHEANKKRIEERKPYLLDREKYYRAMADDCLDEAWAQREDNSLMPDETQLLRDIVRERKGITPAYGTSVQVCKSCGEVGDNCTCGRSWF